jgi:hypothetical protein
MATYVHSRDDLRRILSGSKEPIESGMPEVIAATYRKITNTLLDKKLAAIDMVRRLQYAIRYNPATVGMILRPIDGYSYDQHLVSERMIREQIENATDVYENFQTTYNSYSNRVLEINVGDNAYRRYFVYKIRRDMLEICGLMNTLSTFIRNMNGALEVMADITSRLIFTSCLKLDSMTATERRRITVWTGDFYLSDEDMNEIHRDFMRGTEDRLRIADTIKCIYDLTDEDMSPLLDHVIKTVPPISGEDTVERIAHLMEAIITSRDIAQVD